jgi:hypothetical protein
LRHFLKYPPQQLLIKANLKSSFNFKKETRKYVETKALNEIKEKLLLNWKKESLNNTKKVKHN